MSEWQEHIPLKRSQNVQKEKMNKLDYIEIRTSVPLMIMANSAF